MRRFLLSLVALALLLSPIEAWSDGAPGHPPMVLNQTALELGVGRHFTFALQNAPAGAKVAWTTSSASVAAVNKSGVVYAKRPGTAYITAQCGGLSLGAKVVVYALPQRISLSKARLTVTEGKKVLLTARVAPAAAREKAVAWSSSAEGVATVDQKGVVTAVHMGAAKITARTKNGVKATCTVRVESKTKYIALTFDDGPRPNTLRVLRVLEKYHVHATFFMVGVNVEYHPDIARRVAAGGNEIGNHTYNHYNLLRLTLPKIRNQLSLGDDIIEKVTGKRPTLVRAPGGSINAKVAKAVGRPFVQWSVDPWDWKYQDSTYIFNYVTKNAGNGQIVIMHDKLATTAAAVERIVPWLVDHGYVFLTVSELMEMSGGINPDTMIYWHG